MLAAHHDDDDYKWWSSYIWPIGGNQTGFTTSVQCGPGSNGNKGVNHILLCSRTGVSPSEGLILYAEHSLVVGRCYHSTEMQTAYSLGLAGTPISVFNGRINSNIYIYIFKKKPKTG